MHRIISVLIVLTILSPSFAGHPAESPVRMSGFDIIGLDSGWSLQDTVLSESDTILPTSGSVPQIKDTIIADPIVFTPESASAYMIRLLDTENLWSSFGDTMRLSLSRLIDHFHEPIDSVESRLKRFNFDSIQPGLVDLVKTDTLPLMWLNDSTVIIDTIELEKEPYIIQKTIIKKAIDTTDAAFNYKLSDIKRLFGDPGYELDSIFMKHDSIPQVRDSTSFGEELLFQKRDLIMQKKDSLQKKRGLMVFEQDTVIKVYIDTLFLASKNIKMHQVIHNRITPPFLTPDSKKRVRFLPDSSKLILSESESVLMPQGRSPFYIVPNEEMPDSLRTAVETILTHTAQRDSILLYFNDIRGHKSPFWLTAGTDDLYRYWVKNYKNDSITIWMGNPSKHDITMILEQDVDVNRLDKVVVEDLPITEVRPLRSLAKVEPLKEIPVYWDYSFSSTFALNQTFLSNWAKGGENSFSNMLDISGEAKHTNKEEKTEWTNSFRLKYGSTITEEYGLRTNTDMFNLNSQFNKEIREKMDFSGVFYMKNQIARGYKYPDDSTVVSKFLNPTSFTIGAGLEYKPFKKTTLNFSVLSYKNTFVLDTARIDQTRHGIEADKRVRQEMGGQLLIKNSVGIMDGLNVSNTLRLFANYLNKPQNVDVDWEINVEQKINWYFTVLLNLHFIYDDDIRFPVLDQDDQPILMPDGSTRKEPKLQFKEFLGVTLSFKF
jgi:hypothetical protein